MNHIKDTVFQLQNRVLKHFFKSISCEQNEDIHAMIVYML